MADSRPPSPDIRGPGIEDGDRFKFWKLKNG
jgi:hypothetical protein